MWRLVFYLKVSHWTRDGKEGEGRAKESERERERAKMNETHWDNLHLYPKLQPSTEIFQKSYRNFWFWEQHNSWIRKPPRGGKDFPQETIFDTKSINVQEKVYFWYKLKGEIGPMAPLGILEAILVRRSFEKATVFHRLLWKSLISSLKCWVIWLEECSPEHVLPAASSYRHLTASRCYWATGATNLWLFRKLIWAVRIVVRKL